MLNKSIKHVDLILNFKNIPIFSLWQKPNQAINLNKEESINI